MLAPIHPHIAASCAVFAQEHADAAWDFPTASARPQWFPCALPLSSPVAIADSLISPPRGEGHPLASSYSIHLAGELAGAAGSSSHT
jgi:hypothetical protein